MDCSAVFPRLPKMYYRWTGVCQNRVLRRIMMSNRENQDLSRPPVHSSHRGDGHFRRSS